ncbi:hypothetical protein NDU88_001936 [Pleurodeles waltl]|uniref:Uncharacterized protein n=1 Tax=Pleurodeles waltl TaxID=8319 RepID=A0AAV7T1G8_PLEWA|nr:hypothetical protein NDU88_001936 [Pleurodeles waltl]
MQRSRRGGLPVDKAEGLVPVALDQGAIDPVVSLAMDDELLCDPECTELTPKNRSLLEGVPSAVPFLPADLAVRGDPLHSSGPLPTGSIQDAPTLGAIYHLLLWHREDYRKDSLAQKAAHLKIQVVVWKL